MAKRKAEHESLGEVLKEIFSSSSKLRKGMREVSTREAWHDVMGSAISKYTTEVLFQRETLHVKLSSSVLREELSYGKEKIINLLNEHLGETLIKKLVLR